MRGFLGGDSTSRHDYRDNAGALNADSRRILTHMPIHCKEQTLITMHGLLIQHDYQCAHRRRNMPVFD
jgi:hypothetical protein